MKPSGSGLGLRSLVRAIVLLALTVACVLSFATAAFATTITGIVTSKATGLPIPGVTVAPMRMLEGTQAWIYNLSPSTTTAADGSYTLTLPRSGKYTMQFTDPDGMYVTTAYADSYLLSGAESIIVADGQDAVAAPMVLESPAGSITGMLTDAATGAPVEAKVTLTLRQNNGSWADLYGVSGASDASGRLSIVGLPPGKYRIRLTPKVANGASPYPTVYFSAQGMGGEPTIVRVLPGQEVTGTDMALAPAGASIRGTALEEAGGAPIRTLQVRCYYISAGDELYVESAWSDELGHYTLPNLVPGPYKLSFIPDAAACSQDSTLVTVAGTTEVEMRFPAGARISGKVTSSLDGTTPKGIMVKACEFVNGCATGYSIAASTLDDGTYSIKGLRPGEYRMVFINKAPHDFATSSYPSGTQGLFSGADGEPIQLSAGQTRTDIDVALRPGGAVAGRVVDDTTGLPLRGIAVKCFMIRNGEWLPLGKPEMATAGDGSYRVSGLSEGSYGVRFFDPNVEYADRFYAVTGTASTVASATYVAVVAGQTASQIDARMGAPVVGEGSTYMATETTAGPGSVTLHAGTTQTDGLTVRFSDAGVGGLVGAWPIDLLETPAPEGATLVGNVLDISTTALYDGQIEITMPYDESSIIGPETDVKLYHFADGHWEDITVSVDTVNNTVTGRTTSLSPIALVGPDPATAVCRLRYAAGAGGSVRGVLDQTVAYGGSCTTVTAVASAGYHFTGWSDGLKSASRHDAMVTRDATYTAGFALNPKVRLTIYSSRTSVYRRHALRLYGTISPNQPNGSHVVVYARKPGSHTWVKLSTRHTWSSHHWSYTYWPRTRGTWYFQVRFGSTSKYRASTSSSLRIRVR